MQTGPEALAEAAKEPTLDEYLKRDPATLQPPDILRIIELERKRRAMFITAEAAKKAKKKGETEDGADTAELEPEASGGTEGDGEAA